ncbi:tetratricopeptide repeat protein [Paucibacter sp. B2R-40]|uniref:tetratricopeptide repeat protein n=1 Tax=Paucibacter sp. B2R-40 TaxID=2893554 RepID=UPI0021E4CC66|nr:tetratricopeptide repeat protein [Paucibacter sp. B2R-40]MCV2355687.1 tetratricopeptide repeat protein [Paucibacter sp. B2R-40]
MNANFVFISAAALLLLLTLTLLLRRSPSQAPALADLGAGPRSLLALGLAGFVVGAYLWLGQPNAWQQDELLSAAPAPELKAAAGVGPEQIAAMVARLAEKLKAQPDDAKGWRMLARSYENLQRYGDAVRAYEQLLRLTPNDADMLSDYAVTLAMSLGRQSLIGEPELLIQRALSAQPNHLQSLALAGSVALEQGHHEEAVAYWRRVLAVVPPGSELAAQVEGSIAKAQAKSQDKAQAKAQAATKTEGKAAR